MSRRGSSGNLFGGSGPQDDFPGIEELIRGAKPVTTRRYRRVRPGRRMGPRRTWPWLIGYGVVIVAMFLFGVFAVIAGASTAVSQYGAADAFAHAPACPAGVDLTSTSADCVGNMVLPVAGWAYSTGDGDELPIQVPPASADDYLYVDYPGNAEFDSATDDFDVMVRAEFWEGQVVTLTAGSPGITVTTNENPSNQGGAGVGDALLGLAFTTFSILLVMAYRPLRQRWLKPGLALRFVVSAMIVGAIASLAAGSTMIVQPSRIALTAIIAPSIAVFICGLVWLSVYSTWKRQGLTGLTPQQQRLYRHRRGTRFHR